MTDPEKLSETGPSQRLVGEADRVGLLLREASETEFRIPPGEFARLVAMREVRARRSRVVQGVAVSVPALAVMCALWWRSHESSPSAIAPETAESTPSTHRRPSRLEPTSDLPAVRVSEASASEVLPASEAPAAAAPKAKRAVRPVSVAADLPSRGPTAGLAPAVALPASPDAVELAPLAQLEGKTPSGEVLPRPTSPVSHRAQDCQALLRAERYSEASQCQAARAEQSTGTAAELALLNQARIETKALGRPELALQTLAAYRRRFPHGVLIREAEIAETQAQKALSSQANRH